MENRKKSDNSAKNLTVDIAEEVLVPNPLTELIDPACSLIGDVASGAADAVGAVIGGIFE